MKTIANFFKSTPVFLMGVILLTSCMKDGSIEPVPKEGQAEFSFNFTTPEPMKVQTRASVAEENHVEMLHLLIFNSGQLVKTVTKTNAELSSSNTTTAKDTWGLKTTLTVGKQYDFVTVANIALPATTVVGVSKADFVMAINAQAYIDTNLTNTTKWMVSNTKPIPMWGEVSTAGNVVSTDQFTIPLKRLMARVNISVATAAQASFELTQVRFYNYNTKGQLIPNHNGTEYKYPSIPAISGKQTTASPAFFGYNNIDGLTATECQNLVYVFENANIGKYSDGTAKKWQDNPTVVIGGKFGGGAETFYRLDFIKVESGNETWLDVKRNHSYNFNITKVNGNGYANPEDALMSAPINMVATVIPWDDGAVAEVTEDGQYRMGVSKKAYSFSKEPSLNNALSIYTTYTQTGLVVKYSDSETNADAGGSAWLTQASLANDGGSDMRIYDLKFGATQNDGTSRIGYIHILSGRMQMVVKVEQSDVVSSLLVVENATGMAIDAIEFAAANGVDPGAQKFKVKWAPKAETLYIATLSMTKPEGGTYEPLKWSYYNTESGAINNNGMAIYTSPIDNQSGEVEFTIKPTPIIHGVDGVNLTTDPFYERSELINFRATGSDGTMRKSVILQQMVMNAVVTPDGFYLADGSDYTFNVKSNRPWRATLTDNGGGMVTNSVDAVLGHGGYNLPDGANVDFKTFDDLSNPTLILGTAKVRIEWLSGDDPANSAHWTTASVDLECGSRVELGSNTYMVNGANIIEIPTRQVAIAMGLNDKPTEQNATDGYLGMGWIAAADYAKLKVDLLWTDIPKMLGAADAVVKSVTYDGKHVAAGKIVVTPGTGVGNSVICLYVDNNGNGKYDTGDVIKWSWHIWNAGGYYPYDANGTPNAIWMDRNLGATTKTENAVSTRGLFYQWGRKDPFPGAETTTAFKPTYNSLGKPASWSWLNSTTTYTLLNTINEPTKASDSWSGSNGDSSWITNNNPSAGTGDKTIYDPCPDGWQVPVRKTQAWNISANTRHWGEEGSNIYTPWSSPSGNKWTGNGITWPTKGDYYPAAGYRHSGGLLNVGSRGYYWSASPGSTNGYRLGFNSGSVYPSSNGSRDSGFSVRCVR